MNTLIRGFWRWWIGLRKASRLKALFGSRWSTAQCWTVIYFSIWIQYWLSQIQTPFLRCQINPLLFWPAPLCSFTTHSLCWWENYQGHTRQYWRSIVIRKTSYGKRWKSINETGIPQTWGTTLTATWMRLRWWASKCRCAAQWKCFGFYFREQHGNCNNLYLRAISFYPSSLTV